jgi:hypothetical protein
MDNDELRLTELYRKHWYLIAMLLLATLVAGFILGWTLRPMLDKHVIILEPARKERTVVPNPT